MACIAVAANPWYNILNVLQIDQCRCFITVFYDVYVLFDWHARQRICCWFDTCTCSNPWYNIFNVLQIDQCRCFITVFYNIYVLFDWHARQWICRWSDTCTCSSLLKAGPLRLKQQLTTTLKIRILSETSILYLIRYASIILTVGLRL